MNLRLGVFIATVFLLPWFASVLTGLGWDDLSPSAAPSSSLLLLEALVLAVYAASVNGFAVRRKGADLTALPRRFQAYLTGGSMLLGWLGVWLARFAAEESMPVLDAWLAISATLLFAGLMPAVLATRAALATLPGLLRILARHAPALPALRTEPAALVLLAVALVGLMGGVARPQLLGWLLWSAPLWLLVALQLLWNESTLFSGLPRGNWQRPVLAVLSGVIVGGVLLTCHTAAGVSLDISLAVWAGFGLFGLIAAQLNELIASGWRGKLRSEVFKRKAFPIPVVVKKN